MNRPNRSLLNFVRGNHHEKKPEIQPQELNDDISGMSLQDLDSPVNQKVEASPAETPTKVMSIKERMSLLRMKFGSGNSPKKEANTTTSPKRESVKTEKKSKQEVVNVDGKRVLVAGDWDAEKKPAKSILKKVSRGESTDNTGTPSDSSNGSDESGGSSSSGGGYLSGPNQPTFLSAPTTPVTGVRSSTTPRKSPSSKRQSSQVAAKSNARKELQDSVRSTKRSPTGRVRPTEKSPRRSEHSSTTNTASGSTTSAVKHSPLKVPKSPCTPSRRASSQETRGRARSTPRGSPRSDLVEGKRSSSANSPRVATRVDVERTRSRSSHSPRVIARAGPELDSSSAVLKTPVRARPTDLNVSCSSLPTLPKDDSKRRKVRSHSQPRPRISRASSQSKEQKSPTQINVVKSTADDEACQTPTRRRKVGPSRHRSTSSSRSPRSQRSPEERAGSPTKKNSPTKSEPRRGVRKSKSLDANALWSELGYKKKSPPLTRSARPRTPSKKKSLEGMLATPSSSKSLAKKKEHRRNSGANSVTSVAAQLEIPTIDSDDESGMRVKYTEVAAVEHPT